MKLKRMLSLTLAASLSIALFSGCGTPKEASAPASEGTAAKQESSASTTISVWAMGEEAKKVSDIAADFEAETGYKVDVQAIPWDGAHDKLLTAIASKTGPDVLQLGTSWMPEFVDAGAVLELTDYIEKNENLKQENFFTGSVETAIFDGKTFGIPWYADTRVLYYRTDILESVGYPEAPKTWEELKDVSAKLRARGADKYGMSWDPKEQSLVFMLANQAGAKYYGTEPSTDFDTDEFKTAATYLSSFFKDGEVPVDLAIVDAVVGLKDEGIAPMFVSGPWMVNIINENAPEISGKWATAVLPKGPVNNDSILGGSNLTVFKYAKNVDAAVEFINYMSKAETQVKFFEATNALPANTKAWELNDKLSNDPLVAVFGEQLQSAKAMPLIPQFEEIAQTWLQSLETIYRGNAEVDATVKSFNEAAQGIMGN